MSKETLEFDCALHTIHILYCVVAICAPTGTTYKMMPLGSAKQGISTTRHQHSSNCTGETKFLLALLTKNASWPNVCKKNQITSFSPFMLCR